ncbi:MAG: CRISPR-associated endonuclease Cas1 [Gammaproteobacteria bacterium]|nr:CRISPR-associated endonuclease Cas1 [Gammaproteobacteria bacterium]
MNALLSYAYSLLVRTLSVTLTAVGFDVYWGFYHHPPLQPLSRPGARFHGTVTPLAGRLGGPHGNQQWGSRRRRLPPCRPRGESDLHGP